ncbi:hypothetical protein MUY14_04995 [Amycolatopsis sp. FBCC-B4732]|uniref:hypothetical protein n=1 Tax=Amycolatopsis sp. FBCC-B4732 TaxID=3079339 RepID=UPI001FF111D3|nr:hypothetical protein [Amycolatopsis sp. FBCC-B4732]UOX89995.1 hypothetical protein MUY14_04995 [Amycolatopsis sp. FBCC-B4732]
MGTAREDDTVVVMWSNPDKSHRDPGTYESAHLFPGQQMCFGISSRSGAFDPRPARSVGAFEIVSGNLHISNFTSTTTFAIENLEGGAELVKVTSRRRRMVIPFEMSRVLIPSWAGLIAVTVFGRPPEVVHEAGVVDLPESSPFQLDETSKYFLVLVALCEPRLRGSSMAAVPSVQEVVDRLRQNDRFKEANRSSVNYHIDYLRERKLRVEQWAMYSANGRMHSKREALVSFALRYDLVREEHLSLLSPPVTPVASRDDVVVPRVGIHTA